MSYLFHLHHLFNGLQSRRMWQITQHGQFEFCLMNNYKVSHGGCEAGDNVFRKLWLSFGPCDFCSSIVLSLVTFSRKHNTNQTFLLLAQLSNEAVSHTPNYSGFVTRSFCFQECKVFNRLVTPFAVVNYNDVPTLIGEALGNSFQFILNVFSMQKSILLGNNVIRSVSVPIHRLWVIFSQLGYISFLCHNTWVTTNLQYC